MKVVEANHESIQQAAKILREGGVVVLPTETVYGLAANAYDLDAIARVYAAKNRPTENPLILHVSDREMVIDLARAWNVSAETLADRFWPGPITLVVHKSARVPMMVTGNLDTVALRMPEHPVALDTIRSAGVPLAMPSANRFSQLSATRVEHLDPELLAHVDLVLDGGPSRIGIESTVVDVTDEPPKVLRLGGISRGDIEAALRHSLGSQPPSGLRRSPGMYLRHYAPNAKLVLVKAIEKDCPGLTFGEAGAGQVHMPLNPSAYAANMYDALHRVDQPGTTEIQVEIPPETEEWEAVRDRLRKASA